MRGGEGARPLLRGATLALAAVLLALAAGLAGGPLATAPAGAAAPGQGPGGPVLVVAEPGDPFGRYYAEILRAEGLNAFAVAEASAVTPENIAPYAAIVLAANDGMTDAQVATLVRWVHGGGNLIAMRPDARLAGLLGLGADTGDLANGYLRVETGGGPGAGITGATMQFHGTADRWSVVDATAVAALYWNARDAAGAPAVTLRSVGAAGGQAAAFTYDLARSVVFTRQGNPAWAGQKRETSTTPIRSADLFYGARPGDVQPDWVDLGKVAIPQADEQQRLLANLITSMSLDRMPLPRFWYLPRGERAAVVMTGDDHGNGGTAGQFERLKAASPPGCSVADWQCVRGTSYLYPGAPLTDAQARAYEAEGFEIALHATTNCKDFTPASLEAAWQWDMPRFSASWGVARPRTSRMHCVPWSDWGTHARTELRHGVRLDANYYYAPAGWVQDRPGMFTGSGFPMRFADLDGSIIDVYQAATQLNDEAGIDYGRHISALLDNALGAAGYYGVFTANMHTDVPDHSGANVIVAEARARGVPVISAVQLLEWLDGRNGSSFQHLRFDAGRLHFGIARAPGSRGLEAMVPARSAAGPLVALTRDGAPVATSARVVKGVEYAVFDAAPGNYVAAYVPAAAAAPAAAGGSARKRRRLLVVRASRRGRVKVPVTCPDRGRRCRIDVRLRHRGEIVARRRGTIRADRTTIVALRLERPTRRRLARRSTLRMTAVRRVRVRGSERTRTTRLRVKVLAPVKPRRRRD